MAKGIGRLIQFGIAKEATRGTPESAATYYIPVAELSIDDKNEKVLDEQSIGVIEDSNGQSIIKEWAEAQITAPIGDKHFPLMLLGALGSLSTGDNPDSDASVKDHTITVGQSAQHQALTLFLDDPLGAQDYKYGLGVLQSLEIKYELGKFLMYTATFKSKKGATATLTPSTTTENRFLPKHLTFKLASAASGLGAASATSIKSLTLKIEKNLEDDDVLGSATPADFLNRQLTISGNIEAIWQNESDFKTAFLAGTAKAMRLDLTNSDVTLGVSANPRVLIDLNKVIFSELSRSMGINDVVKQSLEFKGHYSTTDSKMITATVTNTVASY